MLSLSVLNCKKDDSDDNSTTDDDKKSVPVTVTTTDNSNRILNFSNLIIDQLNGSQSKNPTTTTTTTSNYEYNGRHIVKVTSNDGTDVSVSDYYYADMDKGILDSIVYKTNGQFTAVDRFEVSNGHIQQIAKYDANNNIVESATFSGYNGDLPQQVDLYSTTAQGAMNLSGTLTYNGNNIASLSSTGTLGQNNISLDINYNYDTKNNVFLNVETMAFPLVNEHNIASYTTQINFSGINLSKTITFNYTYNNGDFPINGTYTGTDSTSGSLEYVYEDK